MTTYTRQQQEVLYALIRRSVEDVQARLNAGDSPKRAVLAVVSDLMQRNLLSIAYDDYTLWWKKLLAFAEHYVPRQETSLIRPDDLPPLVLGVDSETEEHITITTEELSMGLAVFGGTGSGKTTQTSSLFLQHCNAGGNGAFFDGDGDGINEVLLYFTPETMKRVLLFDFADTSRFLKLNPLATLTTTAHVTRFLEDCEKLWKIGKETPNLVNTLMATILTLAVNKLTISEIPLLLRDKDFRETCIKAIPHTVDGDWLRWFWEQQYTSRYQGGQTERADSTLNKILQLLIIPQTANILSQEQTVNMRQLIEGGYILLIKLSVSQIGKDAVNFLSTFLISELKAALFARSDTHISQRAKFMLLADEWHLYQTPDFLDLFTRGRRFGVETIAVTQTISQVDETLREAEMQLANIAVFRQTPRDAHEVAPKVAREPQAETEEREIKLPLARPVSGLLNKNATHKDERVYPFFEQFAPFHKLSGETQGDPGGEYLGSSRIRVGNNTKDVAKYARDNKHYDQVTYARQVMDELNHYFYEVMTKTPSLPMPPLPLHRLILWSLPKRESGLVAFPRYYHPLSELLNFPDMGELLSHDQPISEYRDMLKNTLKDQIPSGRLNNHNPLPVETLTDAYTALFTASDLHAACTAYNTLIKNILIKEYSARVKEAILRTVGFSLYTKDFLTYGEPVYERGSSKYYQAMKEKYEETLRRAFTSWPSHVIHYNAATYVESVEKVITHLSFTAYDCLTWRIEERYEQDVFSLQDYPDFWLLPAITPKVEQEIAQYAPGFEALIQEIRLVAAALHADPLLGASGQYEQVETYRRSYADMVKDMEQKLINLPNATCYLSLGSRSDNLKPRLTTLPYAHLEPDIAPSPLSQQVRIARTNATAYTTDRKAIEDAVQHRRANFGRVARPAPGTPHTTVTEEKPRQEAGPTPNKKEAAPAAGQKPAHPLVSVPKETTPNTYLELLYYCSNLTLIQAVKLARQEGATEDEQKKINKREQEKINRLIGLGLVDTIASEETTFLISGGRARLVYTLTKKGFEKLHKEQGLKIINAGGFSPHSYKVNEVTISLIRGVQETHYTLIDFTHEKHFRHSPISVGTQGLEPDCWLCLTHKNQLQSIFLEVDLKHEGSSKLKEKIRRYCQAIDKKAHQGFRSDTIGIAFLNPQGKETDTDRLVRIIEEAIKPEYAQYFLVASITIEHVAPLDLLTCPLFRKPFSTDRAALIKTSSS